MPKLYLIDGNAYIHRAYHALPPLSTSKGELVHAVYGFVRMILKILRSEKPEYLAVCFDHPSPTFRHKEYAPYKAHRKAIDEELKTQIPLSHEAVRSLNLSLIQKPGYEADDLIATLARKAEKDGVDAVIVTADKDILQLVNERIKVWNEQKNMMMDRSAVLEKYGVYPGRLLDMFALMGDASDNVPGVRGIGEKTAVKLVQEYGTLENILNSAGALKGKTGELIAAGREDALKSKFLLSLDEQVPLDITWADCRVRPPDRKAVTEFFCRLEFTSLIKDVLPETSVREACPGPAGGKKHAVRIVPREKDLDGLLEWLRGVPHLCVDLETTGTDPLKADIVGISFAVGRDEGFYIPVGHRYPDAPEQIGREQALGKLKGILEDPRIKKFGQNIKYDLLALKKNGIDLSGIHFDSMVASYCLNPSRMSHGLKAIALDYLGYPMTPIEELIGKGSKQVTMDTVTIESAAAYAVDDVIAVIMLHEKLVPELREKNLEKLFYEVEMPLVGILAGMEWHGVKVNTEYLRKLSGQFEKLLAGIEEKIYALAGEKFNPNSPKQLSVILFEKLGLPVIKRTKTGYCTDEEVLRALSPRHELPAQLIRFRELQKLKSTYIDALLALADPRTRRIHTSFNQAVTATGRLSSSDPNLQNIPVRSEYGREIRRSFVPEDGFLLLSADYSQIDLRVLAHVSHDEVLVNAFRSGEDIHAATAKEIFGAPAGGITPEMRRIAKTINFGIVYGMSAYGLAQQLGIPGAQAKEYIDSYFQRYHGVRRWLDRIVDEARKKGYVTTLLGRLRYLPEINATNVQMKSFAERTATNTPIQGTSADIIKVAMVNLSRALSGGAFRTRMLLQVHDELLFEVPEGELQKVLPLIKREMEGALTLEVPVVVDCKKGYSWADMEKIDRLPERV